MDTKFTETKHLPFAPTDIFRNALSVEDIELAPLIPDSWDEPNMSNYEAFRAECERTMRFYIGSLQDALTELK